MVYYLIFTKNNEFKGYTTDKDWAKGVVEQRKEFEPLEIRKVKKSKLPTDVRLILNRALKNLTLLYDVFVFDDEEEYVMNEIYTQNSEMFNSFDDYIALSEFFKHSSKEEELIMEAFYNIVQNTLGILEGEYSTVDEPLSQIKHTVDLTKVGLEALQKKILDGTMEQ